MGDDEIDDVEDVLPLTMAQVERLAPLLGEKIDRLSASGPTPLPRLEAIQVAIVDTMLVCSIADPDAFMDRWEAALTDPTQRTNLPADEVVTRAPAETWCEDAAGNRIPCPPPRKSRPPRRWRKR